MVKTPFIAPIANCYAESWIGSFKRECLNHLFCLGLGHLDHVTRTYAAYHNTVRPHQNLGNVPPLEYGKSPSVEPATSAEPIRCQRWLGDCSSIITAKPHKSERRRADLDN